MIAPKAVPAARSLTGAPLAGKAGAGPVEVEDDRGEAEPLRLERRPDDAAGDAAKDRRPVEEIQPGPVGRPADRFQRDGQGVQPGLTEFVGEVPGMGTVRWADDPASGSFVLPLIVEMELLLLVAYAAGLGIAWFIWRRPRGRRDISCRGRLGRFFASPRFDFDGFRRACRNRRPTRWWPPCAPPAAPPGI